jgi:putative hydrolase of the HAD superfamily
MPTRVKAVTFDLWNTLVHNKRYIDYRLPSLAAFLSTNGVELDHDKLVEVDQAAFRYSSELHRISGRRHVHTSEIVGYLLESVGLARLDFNPLVKAYEEALLQDPPELKEGARETLEALYERVKIGIISDTGSNPGRVIRKVLRDYDVLRYFDATVFSDEVGFCKPNEVIFREALGKLGIKPEEAIHVGDILKNDVQGAKRVGMKTAWLKTAEQVYTPEEAPDHTITNLTQLPPLIGL